MTKFTARQFYALLILLVLFQFAGAQSKPAANLFDGKDLPTAGSFNDDRDKISIADTERIVNDVVEKSYPELTGKRISVKIFRSSSDYFRSRFSFSRFLTFRKPHYIISVNPRVFAEDAPPEEAVRAIIAHELAHIAYYLRHNRFELFGLVALESKSFTARFERGADLQAIKRGYGAGLKLYREWLYKNIPANKIAAKKRDYFSPEEIDTMLEKIKVKPQLIDFWIKNVPRNLNEIELASSSDLLK